MNTAYLSARDPQGYLACPITPITPSASSSALCKMAASGACSVADLCSNVRSNAQASFRIGSINRRTVRRGQALYRAGDTCVNFYQLYAGSLKLRMTNWAGEEQIASFPMPGALLGLDGIETGKYLCDAIALEDARVCVLSLSDLLACSRSGTEAMLQFNRVIARETSHYRRLLMVLANMSSEERIASFLLDLSERMASNGYSSREFILKMTREDIAHYLGMKIETVSRAFTRLQLANILDVRRRHLSIRDLDALKKLGMSH
ncbi:Crp/Fnr family transcriptional regulator [Castellaniella sp.]|uniref:Crp/Fnr family transcriptional regulator n=1 Tax=Castellaniella sp. TaxID=1955812 RepID=UPI003A8EE20A